MNFVGCLDWILQGRRCDADRVCCAAVAGMSLWLEAVIWSRRESMWLQLGVVIVIVGVNIGKHERGLKRWHETGAGAVPTFYRQVTPPSRGLRTCVATGGGLCTNCTMCGYEGAAGKPGAEA